MKTCNLSPETQGVLKDLLCQIEHLRMRANEKQDFPPSDYPYRPCQAIIAEKLGFEGRHEWANSEFFGFEAKL
ncbi:MAG: hypothetical protein WC356_01865 [Candidatus Micrarchaeia archaeon]|jgi:hypothetical protein